MFSSLSFPSFLNLVAVTLFAPKKTGVAGYCRDLSSPLGQLPHLLDTAPISFSPLAGHESLKVHALAVYDIVRRVPDRIALKAHYGTAIRSRKFDLPNVVLFAIRANEHVGCLSKELEMR